MALVVFATICFLGCAFLLFVLVQWMRDGKRNTTTPLDVGKKVGEPNEKRTQVVSFPGTVERRDRPKFQRPQVSGIVELPCGHEFGRGDRRRIAYQSVARFSRPDKRT
jgi:hypothetical protein